MVPSYSQIRFYLNLPISIPIPIWYAINIIFLLVSAYLFLRKYRLATLFLFLSAPWCIQLITLSPAFSLLILGLSLSLTLKGYLKLFGIPTIIVATYLLLPDIDITTALNPRTYGFYLDVHRSADNVAGLPLLGKLYYNKYLTVFRHLFLNAASYLDWDRFTFISSSGKAPLNQYWYPQLTVWELLLIIFSLKKLYFKHKRLLLYLFGAALISSIVSIRPQPEVFSTDSGWLVWFFLTLLSAISFSYLSNRWFAPLLLLVLISRATLVNISLQDHPQPNQVYQSYQLLAAELKSLPTNKRIFITDRLGQPHVFLTHFGVISRADYLNSLRGTLPKDQFGFSQPDSIHQFTFTSFTFDSNHPLLKANPSAIWIEYPKNLIDAKNNPSVIRNININDHLSLIETQ